jgi:uncharacterized membrane protein
MSFILASFLYSFVGCLAGLFTHIFNGIIQEHIHFNRHYIRKIFFNFVKVFGVMFFAVLSTALFVLIIPDSLLKSLSTDTAFLHQLMYYLLAFAAFDFTLKSVIE